MNSAMRGITQKRARRQGKIARLTSENAQLKELLNKASKGVINAPVEATDGSDMQRLPELFTDDGEAD
jgi:hypothetical protein